MSKPSLVLVHGSWHCPDHFAPLIAILQGNGYKCVAVALPSTQSADLPPATLTDDVTVVRRAVTDELDRGNNVVVVSHSYGGHPTNRALKGLDSRSRSSDGASTAVLGLAFICALPVPGGPSFLDALGGKPAPLHDVREPFTYVNSPGPEYWFYNDLSEYEAKKWSALLRPQSWRAYLEESPEAAYLHIPSGYLYCEKDHAIPYDIQKGLVGAAIEGGAQFIHTETIDASHSPFLSMPEQTADFVRRVAGEIVG